MKKNILKDAYFQSKIQLNGEKHIICINHAYIKKINLFLFEKLSGNKNFHVTCVGPEFIKIN